ncbi:MAG: zinc dependent phospholipase C family protein [Oscillospiraceae bacterium]|nr:zinc dependent phospholipase C family protein [Oscillospiraceae bacterium]
MRTVDHKVLANLIIKQYMHNIPQKYCNAFYIGCIEPDYNPFSYFHGFLNSYTLYGHNFCNAKKFLERLFKKLNNNRKYKTIYFFHLGLLIHYITDAFTHAHSIQFSGTLKEHKAYEQQLHIAFTNNIKQHALRLSGDFLPCNDINELSRLHELYIKEDISVFNDLIFIFTLIGSIMEGFYPQFNHYYTHKITGQNSQITP